MLTTTFLAACSLFAAVSAQDAPTATIDSGVLIGVKTTLPTATAAVNKFLGVPFAQSPPERFSPPVREGPYGSPRNATQFSAACVQQFLTPTAERAFNNPPPPESEDCLYLNVFAPDTPVSPQNARSVMFWIYGGSLQFGNAGQDAYDGSYFASYEDVIVVTTNYRTNVFGFPASPELNATGRNLGFLDQRAALDWVQRNIAAFGGDPKKVTIFGESAGAFSVDALLTSFPRDSSPPFRGAILQSGQYSYRRTAPQVGFGPWLNLTATLGCPGTFDNNLTCVRAANASRVKDVIQRNQLTFNPGVDNLTLVANPAQARRSNNIAFVPVLAGTNSQEGRVFQIGQNDTRQFLINTFGNNETIINAFLAAYPQGQGGLNTPYDVISQIFTEFAFQCPQAAMLKDSATARIPSWRYYFNASFANTQALPNLGAYHASEIPIVFRTYDKFNTTVQEYALTQYMQSVWGRFARNPQGGPGWNAVDVGVAANILLGANQQEIGGLYQDATGQRTSGSYNLAVLGDIGGFRSSGATIIPSGQVDFRCFLYQSSYDAIRNQGL
ncbi:Carboxylesterase-like protein 5 [Elsinoe fawcettii]|nr:Carboxylesterase-like protein 5 [Elsinoe fawcettii]